MSIVDQVASRIAGLGATGLFLRDIKMGKANKGLTVFLASNSCLSSKEDRKFVVKITLKQAEGQLAKLLAECDDAVLDKYDLPVPRFYHVAYAEDHLALYQEFVECIDQREAWTLGLETQLAEVAYRFSAGLERVYSDAGQAPNTVRVFGKGLIRRVESALGPEAVSRMMPHVEQIEAVLDDLPRVISHNDIAWANLGFQGDDAASERRIKLIDFGMVGRNYAGADFHHFAAAAMAVPKRARVFYGMTARTAELYGHSVGKIRAAAFFYAAHRHIVRNVKGAKDAVFFESSLELLRNARSSVVS